MRLDDITAEWLTAALAEGGADVAPVTDVSQDVIGDIAGMTGAIARLSITYGDGPAGPPSLIAKCPLDDELNRMLNSFTRMYERESTFYAHFADDGAVRSPRCFYNGHDAEADQHLVLLEDLADARPGDNNAGLAPDDADTAIDAIAALHGHYWNRLADRGELMDFTNPMWRQGIPIMQESWEQMRAARPGLVSDDLAACVDAWYTTDWDRWLELEGAAEHTLVHGDFRADNLLFGDGGVTVIDWQMLCRSTPGLDLAWFLGTSIPASDVGREDELLARWAAGVAAAGGPTLDAEAVLHHVCVGAFFWVTSVSQVFMRSFDDPHLEALQQSMAERMVAACDRWELAARFPA